MVNMRKFLAGSFLLLGNAFAQVPFTPIDTNFTTQEVVLAPDLRYRILFQTGDPVQLGDDTAPAKAKLDFLAYLPLAGSSHGYLWTNHETIGPDAILGHGGGATLLEVRVHDGAWQVEGMPRAVDFRSVQGTWNNCLGSATPWGTVLTSEEYEPQNNRDLYADGKGLPDTTTLINGKAPYLNYGWMVEVNPGTRKVIAKRKAMGRFSHEGCLIMPDERTVYLMDDWAPGVFFKFVADKPRDLGKGQLYAYRQTENGGEWLSLPRTAEALEWPRQMALRMGATFFLRLEDLVLANDGTLYLTETGRTEVDLKDALREGGHPARHLLQRQQGTIFRDTCGRILTFDTKTLEMKVFLEGGPGLRTPNHLGNPDNLSYDAKRNLLVIHEDLNEGTLGRVPRHAEGKLFNEIYVLDLNRKAPPAVDDLQRLLVGPRGCETTGSTFTPDYSSLFVNLQHPDPTNRPPYNRDATIVITGFAP